MPTLSLPVSSPLQPRRVLGFGIQIAGGMFYLGPITLSFINPANNLDDVQFHEDKYLRPDEAGDSLKATLNAFSLRTDNTANQITVAPQEHRYENHAYTPASKFFKISQYDMTAPPMPIRNSALSSHIEIGDAHFHSETKKLQDEHSLFFKDNGLFECKGSSPSDISQYDLTSGVVDFPVNRPMSNDFITSPVIQEGETSIAKGVSNESLTSQISTRPQVDTSLCRYHCPWAGCSSKFRRAADRDRHFVTIHGNPVKYFCPVTGCSRGHGLWRGYSRADKVKEHVKKVHRSRRL